MFSAGEVSSNKERAMTTPNVVGQIAPDAEGATDKAAPKTKLAKALPSDRISFDKQMVLLRCFAVGSQPDNKPVTNATLADLAKLNQSTAGVNNVFFADAGLITKAGNGYVPCAEVLSFERAYQFNAETAAQKLAPALRRSWFGQTLLPLLSIQARSEDYALGELAEAARALPEHRNQLRTLLEYLAVADVIDRDGAMVKLGRLGRNDDALPPRTEDTMGPAAAANQGGATPQGGVITSFAANPNANGGAAGGLNLNVSIAVDMMQMATWPPQTVTAFMQGLAQVITAKAAAEASTTR
jgi:hypothetical protein